MVIFEPFKIKVVEPLPLSTREERIEWIAQAGYNVFNLHADQVTIDLLTDSGTSAMSQEQWAAMQAGDESYAGSRSFLELEAVAQKLFQKQNIIPVHQGRAGEHLVFSRLVKKGDRVPSNGHFDTTAANVLDNGGEPVNLPVAGAAELQNSEPFKGNIDLEKLESFLQENGERVPFVLISITNNTGGGQPVDVENIKGVRALCDRFQKRLILDACRFAENAYFVKQRDPSQGHRSIPEIAQEFFSRADIITFSAKKDAFANIGGLVCLDDQEFTEELKNRLVVIEGFPTYGGLAGRDLAAIAQGLREIVDESYLRYRTRTIEWMAERLKKNGVPVLLPAGGHAIFIDGGPFYPKVPPEQFPGLSLVIDLYIEGGIRGVELGNVCFGRRDSQGRDLWPRYDFVRLAMPRRVYTEAHAEYVVQTVSELYQRQARSSGFCFTSEAPTLRHFRSLFAPVG